MPKFSKKIYGCMGSNIKNTRDIVKFYDMSAEGIARHLKKSKMKKSEYLALDIKNKDDASKKAAEKNGEHFIADWCKVRNSNDTEDSCSCLVFDFDGRDAIDCCKKLYDECERLGVRFIMNTSTSFTVAAPSLHVFIPLAKVISKADRIHATLAMCETVGIGIHSKGDYEKMGLDSAILSERQVLYFGTKFADEKLCVINKDESSDFPTLKDGFVTVFENRFDEDFDPTDLVGKELNVLKKYDGEPKAYRNPMPVSSQQGGGRSSKQMTPERYDKLLPLVAALISEYSNKVEDYMVDEGIFFNGYETTDGNFRYSDAHEGTGASDGIQVLTDSMGFRYYVNYYGSNGLVADQAYYAHDLLIHRVIYSLYNDGKQYTDEQTAGRDCKGMKDLESFIKENERHYFQGIFDKAEAIRIERLRRDFTSDDDTVKWIDSFAVKCFKDHEAIKKHLGWDIAALVSFVKNMSYMKRDSAVEYCFEQSNLHDDMISHLKRTGIITDEKADNIWVLKNNQILKYEDFKYEYEGNSFSGFGLLRRLSSLMSKKRFAYEAEIPEWKQKDFSVAVKTGRIISSVFTDLTDICTKFFERRSKSESLGFGNTSDTEWLADLEINKKGRIIGTGRNIVALMTHTPQLKGLVVKERFNDKILFKDSAPWLKGKPEGKYLVWDMANEMALKVYLEQQCNMDIISRFEIKAGILALTNDNSFDIAADCMKQMKPWDGIPRLDTLFIDFLGADDNVYTREITRKQIIMIVKAACNDPDFFCDSMVILQGKQGIGKTYILRKLGDFFKGRAEGLIDAYLRFEGRVTEKSFWEKLRGALIIEFSELSVMKKNDMKEMKAAIGATSDTWRKCYDTEAKSYRRRAVYFGTTNQFYYLNDDTGNRRFFPVCVSGKGIKKISELDRDYIEQVFAEAMTLKDTEDLRKLSPAAEVILEQNRKNVSATIDDEWMPKIEDFLDTPLPVSEDEWYQKSKIEMKNYYDTYKDYNDDTPENTENSDRPRYKKTQVFYEEIWNYCLGKTSSPNESESFRWVYQERKPVDIKRIKSILIHLGFEETQKKQRFGVYGPQRWMQRK